MSLSKSKPLPAPPAAISPALLVLLSTRSYTAFQRKHMLKRSWVEHIGRISLVGVVTSALLCVALGVPSAVLARIKRSSAARHEFMRNTGYPNGRPGYIVDHVVPLACGGADGPSNMQWQTVAEAKVKDKVERQGCGLGPRYPARSYQTRGGASGTVRVRGYYTKSGKYVAPYYRTRPSRRR